MLAWCKQAQLMDIIAFTVSVHVHRIRLDSSLVAGPQANAYPHWELSSPHRIIHLTSSQENFNLFPLEGMLVHGSRGHPQHTCKLCQYCLMNNWVERAKSARRLLLVSCSGQKAIYCQTLERACIRTLDPESRELSTAKIFKWKNFNHFKNAK